MRFFLDHCVPESAAVRLEDTGHDVVRLRDHMRRDAPDADVIAAAQQLDAILLSLNGDFSDLVRFPPAQYGGIVSLQLKGHPETLSGLLERLTAYFEQHPE